MTKTVFLQELAHRLRQLPTEEVQQHLAYYTELIDDMIEDGFHEEAAVAKLGDVSAIAAEIMRDMPLPALVKNRLRPKNGWTVAAIAVAVLGSPLWIPLLLALLLTAGAVFIAIWAVIISLFICVLALACAGVLLMVRSVGLISMGGGYAVFAVGVGLLLLGLVCLAFLAAEYASIGLYRGGRWLFRSVKGLLIVKEE